MKNKIIRITAVFLALFLALLLFACTEKSATKPPTEPKILQVARNVGGRAGFKQHWDAWKASFEKSNPGWKMELIDLGNGDAAAYYKSRIATESLPDIVMTFGMTNFLADSGNLLPLPDGFYDKFGITPPLPYKGKFYGTMNGKQIRGYAINKHMWTEAGITEPPDSWDELIADLQKLKDKGFQPLAYGGREWSAFSPLQYSFEANMYPYVFDPQNPSWTMLRNSGKASFVTDPTAKMLIEKMIQLLDNYVPKGAASDGYDEEKRDFYGGRAATWIMGCWIGGEVEANKVNFDIEYWPFPSMVGRPPVFLNASYVQGGWAMTKGVLEKNGQKGEKYEKAVKALEAFFDPAVYQLFLNAEGQFSIAPKTGVTGPKSPWPPAQKLFDNMQANMARFGETRGYFISLEDQPPPGFEMALAKVMQEILAGNRDVSSLLKRLDEEWDSALKGMGSIEE